MIKVYMIFDVIFIKIKLLNVCLFFLWKKIVVNGFFLMSYYISCEKILN